MVRIAPVRFPFNPKALWFDARDLELSVSDPVVVLTARGLEFGYLDAAVFEATDEQVSALTSPLKPVRRLALDEDVERAYELERKSREAMPVFRELAASKAPEMNPVAVEFLFEGDKAVFYFESEERVDFRDLVRDLAAQFHVRVDMKQIGVRDEARMVGGIGHCGQVLCCTRLGGEFNPVSIRMAKEQGLSLNPQKISGLCGRLMCCLRYEYDAYKDFHNRAPKKNAKIQTPVGEGKVVDMDVPRETVSILVEEEKPVSVPLSDMETVGDSQRPNFVGDKAWERAHATPDIDPLTSSTLLTSQLTEKDKLADAASRNRAQGESRRGEKQGGSSRGSRNQKDTRSDDAANDSRKPRRRRSTKVAADGETSAVDANAKQQAQSAQGRSRSKGQAQEDSSGQGRSNGRTRRRRSSDGARKQPGENRAASNAAGATEGAQSAKSTAPGRKSSALRSREHVGNSQQNMGGHQRSQKKATGSARDAHEPSTLAHEGAKGEQRRVRRRTHRAISNNASGSAGSSGE